VRFLWAGQGAQGSVEALHGLREGPEPCKGLETMSGASRSPFLVHPTSPQDQAPLQAPLTDKRLRVKLYRPGQVPRTRREGPRKASGASGL
jgi:hypothetical protein